MMDANTPPQSEAYNLTPPPSTPTAACSLLTSAPSSCPSEPAYERTASSTSSIRSGTYAAATNHSSPHSHQHGEGRGGVLGGGRLLLSPPSRSCFEGDNISSKTSTPQIRLLEDCGGAEDHHQKSDKSDKATRLLMHMAPPPQQQQYHSASLSSPQSLNSTAGPRHAGKGHFHDNAQQTQIPPPTTPPTTGQRARGSNLILVQNTSNNNNSTAQSYSSSSSSSAPSSHRSSTPSSYRPGEDENDTSLPPSNTVMMSMAKRTAFGGGGTSRDVVGMLHTTASFLNSASANAKSDESGNRCDVAANNEPNKLLLSPLSPPPLVDQSLLSTSKPSSSGNDGSGIGIKTKQKSTSAAEGFSKSAAAAEARQRRQVLAGEGARPTSISTPLLSFNNTQEEESAPRLPDTNHSSSSSAVDDNNTNIKNDNKSNDDEKNNINTDTSNGTPSQAPCTTAALEEQRVEANTSSPMTPPPQPPDDVKIQLEEEKAQRNARPRHLTPMGTPITAYMSLPELIHHRQFMHHQKTQVVAYEHELLHKFILNHTNKVQAVSRSDHKIMLKILISEAYRNDPCRRENKSRWERIMRDAMREVDSKNSVLLSIAPDPYHGVRAKLSSMLLHNSAHRAQYWSYRYWEEEMLRRRSVQQATLAQLQGGRLFLDTPIIPSQQKRTSYF